MKAPKFSEAQIAFVLKQAEDGTGVSKVGRKAGARRILLNRMAAGEDIANSVLFLASDQSSMIAGQTIYVDGGATFN